MTRTMKQTQTQTVKASNTPERVTKTRTNATRYNLRANPAPKTYPDLLFSELGKKSPFARQLLNKNKHPRESCFLLDGILIDHDDDEFLESSVAPSEHISRRFRISSAINIKTENN